MAAERGSRERTLKQERGLANRQEMPVILARGLGFKVALVQLGHAAELRGAEQENKAEYNGNHPH